MLRFSRRPDDVEQEGLGYHRVREYRSLRAISSPSGPSARLIGEHDYFRLSQ